MFFLVDKFRVGEASCKRFMMFDEIIKKSEDRSAVCLLLLQLVVVPNVCNATQCYRRVTQLMVTASASVSIQRGGNSER